MYISASEGGSDFHFSARNVSFDLCTAEDYGSALDLYRVPRAMGASCENCSISRCKSYHSGGAIGLRGTSHLEFSGRGSQVQAPSGGFVALRSNSRLVVRDSHFTETRATTAKAGFALLQGKSTILVQETIIDGASAAGQGGTFAAEGRSTVAGALALALH